MKPSFKLRQAVGLCVLSLYISLSSRMLYGLPVKIFAADWYAAHLTLREGTQWSAVLVLAWFLFGGFLVARSVVATKRVSVDPATLIRQAVLVPFAPFLRTRVSANN